MNYRRGLQRIYAVLTVAWVVIVLFTVLTGHWEPWPFTPPPLSSLDPIDPRGVNADASKSNAKGDIFDQVNLPPPPPGFKLDQPSQAADRAEQVSLPSAVVFMETQRTTRRWEWALGLSLLIPAILYFLLFHVSRWVYRGFQSATQI